MMTAGIDIGSISTKAAVFSDTRILGTKVIFTGYNAEQAGRKVLDDLLKELHLETSAIEKIIATGYGRNSVKFVNRTVTEIICHGAGAYFINPQVRFVIDIGGQDSKAMVLDSTGRVLNFVMNDKCAAGTGRFLEVMARALEVDLDSLGQLSLQADHPSRISNICTVFAESEVISLIAKGESRINIIAGIHESIAARVFSLANRIGITPPVFITGGVAKNIGFVTALGKKLGLSPVVSEYAQVNGAIGAAILATTLR